MAGKCTRGKSCTRVLGMCDDGVLDRAGIFGAYSMGRMQIDWNDLFE